MTYPNANSVLDLPSIPDLSQYVVADDGCWLWTGQISTVGYGRLSHCGKNITAHRAVYELANGRIADGLVLDHLCRVRHCVNPQHLEPVTQGDNIRRGQTGQSNAIKTHCPRGHEYTPENTYVIPGSGGRTCRICQKRRRREWRERQRIQSPAPNGPGSRGLAATG